MSGNTLPPLGNVPRSWEHATIDEIIADIAALLEQERRAIAAGIRASMHPFVRLR